MRTPISGWFHTRSRLEAAAFVKSGFYLFFWKQNISLYTNGTLIQEEPGISHEIPVNILFKIYFLVASLLGTEAVLAHRLKHTTHSP